MGCGSSTSGGGETTQDNRTTTKQSNDNKTATKASNDKQNESVVEEKSIPQRIRSSNSVTGDKTADNKFMVEAVASHNAYRAKHSAPQMKAASDLIEYSQKYANKLADLDKMEHSNCTLPSGGRVGENLYCYWSSDKTAMPTAEQAVKAWYDEIKDYDFSKGGFAMNTGHFTQVVWKGSTELGMAWAKSAKGTTYVVANYRPAGNMMGDFDNNVTAS